MEILCADCEEDRQASAHTCDRDDCVNAREHHAYRQGVVILDELRLRPAVIRWLAILIGDQTSWPEGEHETLTKLQNKLMVTYFEAING